MSVHLQTRACDIGHPRITYEVEVDTGNSFQQSYEQEHERCPVCRLAGEYSNLNQDHAQVRRRVEELEGSLAKLLDRVDHMEPALNGQVAEYYAANSAAKTLDEQDIEAGQTG